MSLADSLREWQPGTVEMERQVDPWPAAAFAGLIGAPEPAIGAGDPLPPMWHWFTVLEHPATALTGPDGHPAEGALLPPIPGRRRMFAGGRLRVQAPIAVGSLLRARSEVSGIAIKRGRSGEMAFVTIRTALHADGVPAAIEEQDIVYRSEPAGAALPTMARPEGGLQAPAGDWRVTLATDPVLLFRFSALTYNGHRIHYDQPYATSQEGYPGLVIHGPLLALLALDLPRVHAPGRAVTAFEYRLVRPAFAPAAVVATGTLGGDGHREVAISVGAAGAEPSLVAKATLEGS
ncbi:MAG TPA: MaoC family dehydratase N-terminal domain-containing protein [Trebonia sp.]|nr:MaoC family dehydratase N-terminal domain-containing protein [Trebonia sp.]